MEEAREEGPFGSKICDESGVGAPAAAAEEEELPADGALDISEVVGILMPKLAAVGGAGSGEVSPARRGFLGGMLAGRGVLAAAARAEKGDGAESSSEILLGLTPTTSDLGETRLFCSSILRASSAMLPAMPSGGRATGVLGRRSAAGSRSPSSLSLSSFCCCC